jgi:hypothetical protein
LHRSRVRFEVAEQREEPFHDAKTVGKEALAARRFVGAIPYI